MIISNSLSGISLHLQFFVVINPFVLVNETATFLWILFFHSTGVAQSSTDSFSSLLCFCQNVGSRKVKNRVSQRLLFDQLQFKTT